MIPKNRIPAHPGEILAEEYLQPLGLTQVEFAAHDLARFKPKRRIRRLAKAG